MFYWVQDCKGKKILLISNRKSLHLNNISNNNNKNNNNNNNDNNGNFTYLFECIVNLATYRQFTIGCLRLNCSKKNQNFIKSGLFPFLSLQQKM